MHLYACEASIEQFLHSLIGGFSGKTITTKDLPKLQKLSDICSNCENIISAPGMEDMKELSGLTCILEVKSAAELESEEDQNAMKLKIQAQEKAVLFAKEAVKPQGEKLQVFQSVVTLPKFLMVIDYASERYASQRKELGGNLSVVLLM